MIYEKNQKAMILEKKHSIKAISEIEKPAYDLSLVKERCFELMTEIRNQVSEKKDYGQEQLSTLYGQLMEKTDQYQVKEKLSEKIDSAANQITSIKNSILERYESAQVQMDEIHKSMISKYSASKKQIDEIHRVFQEKSAESKKAFETACEIQERKLIN
jgi:DNA repair exonuclease SbcCD nuclease subunit